MTFSRRQRRAAVTHATHCQGRTKRARKDRTTAKPSRSFTAVAPNWSAASAAIAGVSGRGSSEGAASASPSGGGGSGAASRRSGAAGAGRSGAGCRAATGGRGDMASRAGAILQSQMYIWPGSPKKKDNGGFGTETIRASLAAGLRPAFYELALPAQRTHAIELRSRSSRRRSNAEQLLIRRCVMTKPFSWSAPGPSG